MALPGEPINEIGSATLSDVRLAWIDGSGATSHNIYWSLTYPDFFFANQASFNAAFTEFKAVGSETAIIQSGGLKLTLPSGDMSIIEKYKYEIPNADFDIRIDITSYNNTDMNKILTGRLILDGGAVTFDIRYGESTTLPHRIYAIANINGEITSQDDGDIGGQAEKLRIQRIGDSIYYKYYYSSAWVDFWSVEVGSYINTQLNTSLRGIVPSGGTTGGYIIFDNLMLLTKENEIAGVSSPYTFNPKTSRATHYFTMVAENDDGESFYTKKIALQPWQHYFLGPDRAHAIELFPDYSFKDGEIDESQKIRTGEGRLYNYKFYDYKQISFNTDWIPASDAAVVNSWWNSQTKLTWFTELGSATFVDSVMLKNNFTPFSEINKSLDSQYRGKIILEEYV